MAYTNNDIYLSALALVDESAKDGDTSDLAERAPFLIASFCSTCKTLDKLDYCIGEHVWNFADFKTNQGLKRVGGNRKGVFTKARQPKMAAYYLKERWENK